MNDLWMEEIEDNFYGDNLHLYRTKSETIEGKDIDLIDSTFIQLRGDNINISNSRGLNVEGRDITLCNSNVELIKGRKVTAMNCICTYIECEELGRTDSSIIERIVIKGDRKEIVKTPHLNKTIDKNELYLSSTSKINEIIFEKSGILHSPYEVRVINGTFKLN